MKGDYNIDKTITVLPDQEQLGMLQA